MEDSVESSVPVIHVIHVIKSKDVKICQMGTSTVQLRVFIYLILFDLTMIITFSTYINFRGNHLKYKRSRVLIKEVSKIVSLHLRSYFFFDK